jgi:DNA-directed RNA polymerase specialized sigma24 family protein
MAGLHVPPSNREDRDLLMRVLERVSPDCRGMWRLILAGLSYREMSGRLNVAEGTLRVRVLRCREKASALREELLQGIPPDGRNVAVKDSPNKSRKAKTNDL